MGLIRNVMAAAAVFGLAGAATAQDALDRLERAREAIQEAKSMSYEIRAKTSGGFGPSLDITGRVEMLRNPSRAGTWFVRREGVAKLKGMDDIQYLVVGDGQTMQWLDHEKKTLYERYTHAARDRQISISQNGWLMHLGDRDPFKREMGAESVTLVGTETFDGTPCEIVFVNHGENRQNLKIWFGVEDRLPRKVEQSISGAGMSMTTVYELLDFKLNPDVKEDRFKLEPPAGYAEERVYRAPDVASPTGEPGMITLTPDAGGDAAAQAAPQLRKAPEFELEGPDGKVVRLADLRDKIVVLDFWGTWCFPCKKSTPELQRLHEEYKDRGVKVLGLAVRESDWSAPAKYMKDGGFTYQILLRADEVAKQYAVRPYPSFFVIGKDGMIVHEAGGFKEGVTFEGIRRAIDMELSGERPTRPVQGGEQKTTFDGQSTTTNAPPSDR